MSDLVGNPTDRFFHKEAHIIIAVNNKSMAAADHGSDFWDAQANDTSFLSLFTFTFGIDGFSYDKSEMIMNDKIAFIVMI